MSSQCPGCRPVVYIDVDGVLTVPARSKSEQSHPEFVRDEPWSRDVELGWPTAKQSWKSMPLGPAPEARHALSMLGAHCELYVLSALPPWACAEVGARVFPADVTWSVLVWKNAHASKFDTIQAHHRGTPWAWIDDKPTPEDLNSLHESGRGNRLFTPNCEEGLTHEIANSVLVSFDPWPS